MREMLLQADPHLLQWLRDTLGRELEEPDDLEKITQLRAEPDWRSVQAGVSGVPQHPGYWDEILFCPAWTNRVLLVGHRKLLLPAEVPAAEVSGSEPNQFL